MNPSKKSTAGSLWPEFSTAEKVLCSYAALMVLGLIGVYAVSLWDERTWREVGIWAKPMKFLAATALFASTTVVLSRAVAGEQGQGHPMRQLARGQAFQGITALIIVTSLFEVVYIGVQAALGEGSHYNTRDPLHAFLFGLMAVAAVALVASQAWLAWAIWQCLKTDPTAATSTLTPLTLAVLMGLVLTCVLSTVSGFMLGGLQPPAGGGLPVVGWHGAHDVRPAHFLAVHAQQFIPLAGLLAHRLARGVGQGLAKAGLLLFTAAYLAAWVGLSVMGTVGLP